MAWTDQEPPCTDEVIIFCISGARLVSIDKIADGTTYRATIGNLWKHQELGRNTDLEALLRHVHKLDLHQD